jgi:WXG100 family type VII secretion target
MSYNFSRQAMDQIIGEAGRINGQIKSLLNSLEQDLGRSLAHWTGEAQQAYRVEQNNWRQASENMPSALADATTTLEEIADRYGNAEKSGASRFGG